MPARILVVEDEDLVADLLVMRLMQSGYHVEARRDGPSAREQAQSESPDMMICDIWLPGCTGLDLIRDLRAAGATFPIVAMTASRYGAEAAQALELGAVAVLHKPFSFDLLLSTVRSHLPQAAADGPLPG